MFHLYSTCGKLLCIVSMEAKELASTLQADWHPSSFYYVNVIL